jgi:hypothetical protein
MHVGGHFNNFSVRLQQRFARSFRNAKNAGTSWDQIELERKGDD